VSEQLLSAALRYSKRGPHPLRLSPAEVVRVLGLTPFPFLRAG
jgi:hypothetical protein